ncbi:MAG: ATP-binding protein [Chloroflexota bacterium]|nr:ATP-binding protein [Chloroflexota bacterium]
MAIKRERATNRGARTGVHAFVAGERLPESHLARTAFLAELGAQAATEQSLQAIFDAAVAGVARLLDHEYCKVLELLPDRTAVKLVSGVGWQPGLVGHATVGTGRDSQAGYTLATGGPVIVTDLRTEPRFWGPPLLRDHGVISGMSTVIPGPDGPWGVLGTHSTRQRSYSAADPAFLSAVASLLGAAIARLEGKRDSEAVRERLTVALGREEARASELRAVIGAIGDAVLVFDELDRLLLMNQSATALLDGMDVRQLRDAGSALELHDPRELERVVIERPLAGTGRWVEAALYRVPLWSTPVDTSTGRQSHENRASSILVLRDVTLARQARQAREAFIDVLSHELRTPITTIYGGAHMLTRELEPAKRQAVLADVLAEADRLDRMVEDLLVLSRVERDTVEVVLEPVSLQRLVPEFVAFERARWPDHRIEHQVGLDLPPVAADRTYVEQVLRNVVGNAGKFSRPGSRIDIVARTDGEFVEISVLDEGPGFDPQEAYRLFELFYRAPSTKRTPGSGIGLYVSRRLVEEMGGRMHAEPRPGRGAAFVFTLRQYAE